MVPIELLKRYPFFASLNNDQLKATSRVGEILDVEEDYFFSAKETS